MGRSKLGEKVKRKRLVLWVPPEAAEKAEAVPSRMRGPWVASLIMMAEAPKEDDVEKGRAKKGGGR